MVKNYDPTGGPRRLRPHCVSAAIACTHVCSHTLACACWWTVDDAHIAICDRTDADCSAREAANANMTASARSGDFRPRFFIESFDSILVRPEES